MDILDLVCLVVPCAACGGTAEISARVVRGSEKMLHEGCPVQNSRNCPEIYYSSLIDSKALDELCAAWSRLEASARAHGNEAVLRPSGSTGEVAAKVTSGRSEQPKV
jgi:hypothetical protein